MKFEIPPLPYAKDALEPHLSAETLELYYEKHHKDYLENLLRKSIEGTPDAERDLIEIVRTCSGDLFNNAAQEHASYVHYRNERARCVDAFRDHLLNWDFVATNLALEPSVDPRSSWRYRESSLASRSDETEPNARSGASAGDAG